jgi:hypothetical protein
MSNALVQLQSFLEQFATYSRPQSAYQLQCTLDGSPPSRESSLHKLLNSATGADSS